MTAYKEATTFVPHSTDYISCHNAVSQPSSYAFNDRFAAVSRPLSSGNLLRVPCHMADDKLTKEGRQTRTRTSRDGARKVRGRLGGRGRRQCLAPLTAGARPGGRLQGPITGRELRTRQMLNSCLSTQIIYGGNLYRVHRESYLVYV